MSKEREFKEYAEIFKTSNVTAFDEEFWDFLDELPESPKRKEIFPYGIPDIPHKLLYSK